MAMSTKESNGDPSDIRFVRLVFLKRDSDQHPLEDWLIRTSLRVLSRIRPNIAIAIHSKSTFGDIQEGLVPKYQDQFIVLQTTFGPVPYWTKPEPSSYIDATSQTLYAVSNKEYVLALVRTSASDYPIALSTQIMLLISSIFILQRPLLPTK
jgi:hypothetical protein